MLYENKARYLLLHWIERLWRFGPRRSARLGLRPPAVRRAGLQPDVATHARCRLDVDAHERLEQAPTVDRELLALSVRRREAISALEHLRARLRPHARVVVQKAAARLERFKLGRVELGHAHNVVLDVAQGRVAGVAERAGAAIRGEELCGCLLFSDTLGRRKRKTYPCNASDRASTSRHRLRSPSTACICRGTKRR